VCCEHARRDGCAHIKMDPDMIEVWKSGEGSKESREKRVFDLMYCGFFCSYRGVSGPARVVV
jgi:hypothetical protein